MKLKTQNQRKDLIPLNGATASDSRPGRTAATLIAAIPDATTITNIPATKQPRSSNGNGGTAETSAPNRLSEVEKAAQATHEQTIRQSCLDQAGGFHKLALTCYYILRDRLYREYATQAAYFKAKFGFSRSYSLRLANMGRLLAQLSPTGDIFWLLASDAHLRPLLKLTDEQLDVVISKLLAWSKLAAYKNIPAKLVATAVTVLYPSEKKQKPTKRTKKMAMFLEAVEAVKAKLPPASVTTEVLLAFDNLEVVVVDNAGVLARSTGIEWTEHTWNPLRGCSRCSKGCDECYAARHTATRGADQFPGGAVAKRSSSGKITYHFTGKVELLPERLAEPLENQTGQRYFVNSMSDLFHENVAEAYIDEVFDVMEKASWHTFQVLTKRPERMATYTQKRYGDKEPPRHIWLGTSTEDQDAYDKRINHLRQTKAAVRWLSVEPLLGPIQFGSTAGIDWVVVGGESGPNARPMKKEWAVSIRDACKTAKIPFFFKQWGAFNEEGVKEREPAGPSKLDGKIHHEYPTH